MIAQHHLSTRRDYLGRMQDDKVACSIVAREYGRDYWDGDRRYGFGGYRYDGRWKPVAEKFIREYALEADARILDVGCGKAFLLHELHALLPASEVAGIDSSNYALENAHPEVRACLRVARAEDRLPFPDDHFDLALSLMTLHNLTLPELADALREMERVAKRKYVAVESYRSPAELFNLQCWALTCESFLRPEEWVWLFDQVGYTGDYEFLFFE
jgi:ubiquinone/menaquinone biosynthesis C-methylase UbiE